MKVQDAHPVGTAPRVCWVQRGVAVHTAGGQGALLLWDQKYSSAFSQQQARAFSEYQIQSETQTCCILGGFTLQAGVQPRGISARRHKSARVHPTSHSDVVVLRSAFRFGAAFPKRHKHVAQPSMPFRRLSDITFHPVCAISCDKLMVTLRGTLMLFARRESPQS